MLGFLDKTRHQLFSHWGRVLRDPSEEVSTKDIALCFRQLLYIIFLFVALNAFDDFTDPYEERVFARWVFKYYWNLTDERLDKVEGRLSTAEYDLDQERRRRKDDEALRAYLEAVLDPLKPALENITKDDVERWTTVALRDAAHATIREAVVTGCIPPENVTEACSALEANAEAWEQ